MSCGNMCSVALLAKTGLITYKIQVICSLKKEIVSYIFMKCREKAGKDCANSSSL